MKMTKQSLGSQPKAPTYQELPIARPRAVRSGPELAELRVRLEVVTPILGGSHKTRAIDDVDVIRAPSLRGHLRFWWRALYASQCSSAEELHKRESALWGRAATDHGGRSWVEVRVNVEGSGGAIDDSDINLQQTPGAYALWPARAEKKQGQVVKPPAPRRKPGTKFQLTLKVAATAEAETRNALRAWILFGGYGGRTRRGLGSLKVLDDASGWLPSAGTRAALTSLFGLDIFAAPTKAPCDVPWFGGAAIHVGSADRSAQKAWTTALDWLKEFRQGTTGQQGERAREPGAGKAQPQRPSISNWPEADKIRRIKNKTNAHAPRHNATAAWPRAGFGLPIIGQFQTKGRNDERYDEPGAFELSWRAGNIEHDRLASPLIVKALPLADDTFAPCALWLSRAHPANGQVVLRNANNSQAPFDRLVASGDTARFSALANKTSLRQAFLDWLHSEYKTTVVAP
ncbi:MAG: type III-B CRISPR module RAMP protein Cmr1 [Polyangiaceae bacterium]|nr:type III-B CRISPR module RAMP protein Cmr1 [Polyangiaceae bacterium]